MSFYCGPMNEFYNPLRSYMFYNVLHIKGEPTPQHLEVECQTLHIPTLLSGSSKGCHTPIRRSLYRSTGEPKNLSEAWALAARCGGDTKAWRIGTTWSQPFTAGGPEHERTAVCGEGRTWVAEVKRMRRYTHVMKQVLFLFRLRRCGRREASCEECSDTCEQGSTESMAAEL